MIDKKTTIRPWMVAAVVVAIVTLFVGFFVSPASKKIIKYDYNYGFGVDSQGIVYLGANGIIVKFYQNEEIGSLDPQTTRGYRFTVLDDDTVLLSDWEIVYHLDSNGSILNKKPDQGGEVFRGLENHGTFQSAQGTKYTFSKKFGIVSVTNETGAVVYETNNQDKILLFLDSSQYAFLTVLVPPIVVWAVIDQKKRKSDANGYGITV
ncbi:MAG: hypothetical protein II738_01765 [Clostridia bacterium]|nr:hypothetical protein [Clostridia bacterium]